MIGIIISLVAGIMAAASLIIKFKPESKDLLSKLVPYQGVVGLVLLGWGIWNTVQLVRLLGFGGFSLVATATVAIQLIVGFLLSFGLLSQYVFSKSEEAKQKGEALQEKLVGYQGVLGLVLIGLSVLAMISVF